MKKLLIATAALALVAGSAVAQSSATVSGRMDIGFSDKSLNANASSDTTSKTIVDSPMYSNFLRFSGSEDLGGGLKEITAVIANKRMIPTHSSQDLKYKIEVPDMVSIEGTKVIAGMIVENRDLNITKEQKNKHSTIQVANIPGNATVTVRWIVQNAGKYTVKVESKKGGIATKSKN
jgi:hypothetical protein